MRSQLSKRSARTLIRQLMMWSQGDVSDEGGLMGIRQIGWAEIENGRGRCEPFELKLRSLLREAFHKYTASIYQES